MLPENSQTSELPDHPSEYPLSFPLVPGNQETPPLRNCPTPQPTATETGITSTISTYTVNPLRLPWEPCYRKTPQPPNSPTTPQKSPSASPWYRDTRKPLPYGIPQCPLPTAIETGLTSTLSTYTVTPLRLPWEPCYRKTPQPPNSPTTPQKSPSASPWYRDTRKPLLYGIARRPSQQQLKREPLPSTLTTR